MLPFHSHPIATIKNEAYSLWKGIFNGFTFINFFFNCASVVDKKRIVLASVIVFVGITSGWSQELNARVQVDKSRLSGSSLGYLDNFAKQVETYLNEYNWVDARFDEYEKIDVDIRIILMNTDNNYNFEANLIISSRRPVYNSLQQTPLFLHNDENWTFNYTPNRGFLHDDLQFDSITTLLDFYAYIILGFDFDSFSELGGTPYFKQAQNLISLAQVSSSPGWSRNSRISRNRAQFVADLINPGYRGLRRAVYVYHRHGMDQFLADPNVAREEIISALKIIRETRRNTTSNNLFNTFFDAKYRELVSIFEDAPTDMRLEAYNLLSKIDQSHLSEYEKLR